LALLLRPPLGAVRVGLDVPPGGSSVIEGDADLYLLELAIVRRRGSPYSV
jgi:hypothetical protein